MKTSAHLRYPFLSPIFSDHMVLQRDRPNRFWGWTTPGERIDLSISDRTASSVAGEDGKWGVEIDPPEVGGPYSVTVSGPTTVTLSDVMVGDVWLCGGQSNMQFGLIGCEDGPAEVAAADHPNLRFAVVPISTSLSRRDFISGTWQVCKPETLGTDEWNGLSAVGYFFGREIQQALQIPIGLVHNCRGGSSAESWISRETLEARGDFGDALKEIDESVSSGHRKSREMAEEWIGKSDPGSTREDWSSPACSDTDWNRVSLPGGYDELGLVGHIGITWFRTTFELPIGAPSEGAVLHLGGIADYDWTWVNGEMAGSGYGYDSDRAYKAAIRPGRNTIAIRVLNVNFGYGFVSTSDRMFVELADGSTIPLSGPVWKMKQGVNLWSGSGEFPLGVADHFLPPALHYNGMIHPVAPLAIRGVIWYQGESNVGRSRQYVELMQTVASEWRRDFQTEDLPFLQVQLAAFLPRTAEPGDSSWAALREAQQISSVLIPGGGLATAVDVGDADDVHPRNKRDVGIRLAKLALREVYERDELVGSGPVFRSFSVEGSAIRIYFDHAEIGLVAKEGRLTGFAVAGMDRRFYWADATIEYDEVVLRSSAVAEPVAARYGWSDNPEMSLYSRAGLPAFPFRTDDWPVV